VNTYEVLVVFKPSFDGEGLDGAIKSLENLIQNQKGKILYVDRMGRKKLAFEMKRFREGAFVNIMFEAPPEEIVEFRRLLKINESILRVSLLRLDRFHLPANYLSGASIAAPMRGGERRFDGGRPERSFDRPGFQRHDRGPDQRPDQPPRQYDQQQRPPYQQQNDNRPAQQNPSI
jgi:small subunit ribosomal protein S6